MDTIVINFDIFFFFNDTATTEIYTLSLHDALPISGLEHRHHLGHHEHQQQRHDAEAHHRQHDGIEHRRQHLLADLLAALGVVGQPLEQIRQKVLAAMLYPIVLTVLRSEEHTSELQSQSN